MRLSFTLKKPINSLFINNGIIGVINGKAIDFFNLLGGNSVLITCNGYNNIINSVVDNVNNLLITYDSSQNIIFYDLKLSISRVTTNECYPIYKLNIFSIYQKNKRNVSNNIENFSISSSNSNYKNNYFNPHKDNLKMEIFKNILLVMNGNKYLLAIDLNFNQKNPEIERVIYYREFLINTYVEKNKIDFFSQNLKNIKKRKNYISTINDEIFKITFINKDEILILTRISNYDFCLISFSKEKFSNKNFYLSKEYLNSISKTIPNILDDNKNVKNHQKQEKLEENKSFSFNYNFTSFDFFTINSTKIKDDLLEIIDENIFLVPNRIKNKIINNASSNEYFTEDNYYKLVFSKLDTILIYFIVIILVIIFTFCLRKYFNKQREEKGKLFKEKIEELHKLNLNNFTEKNSFFEKNEIFINKNRLENDKKLNKNTNDISNIKSGINIKKNDDKNKMKIL